MLDGDDLGEGDSGAVYALTNDPLIRALKGYWIELVEKTLA